MMKKSTLAQAIGLTLALSLPLSMPLSAQADEFRIDRLFVVGDSLSDGGAYTATATQGLLAAGVPAAAIPGRMKFTTNGPTSQMWNQVLADKLGIRIDVDVINGLPAAAQPNGGNYAQGGSRVSNPAGIGNNPAQGITTIPVTEQVNRLLADSPRFTRNDLVALWAGSNDGFVQFATIAAGGQTPQQGLAAMASAATDMLAQIDRLKAAGASNIVVVTVPNLGITPQARLIDSGAPGAAGLLTALADSFNTTLNQQAAQKGAVVVNSSKILSAILADPVKYGFTAQNAATVPACGSNPQATGPDNAFNTSLLCIRGVNATPDSETRIFADGVHPTAAAQRMFGEAAYAGLQAAGINGVLAAAPLTPIRQHALGLENRLSAFALVQENDKGEKSVRPVGHTEWYGGVELGNYNSDQQQVQVGLNTDTQILKLGADRMITGNALIGAGLSIDRAQTDFDNNAGGFDTDLYIGSLFTTIALSKNVYVNGAVAMGRMDYDLERKFTLGAAQERYTASPKSDFTSVRVGGGYIHNAGNGWTLNPQLSYTDEKIELDAYNESNGAASLSFGATEYKAERVSLALAITKDPESRDGWRPLVRYSIEHDMNNEDLKIRMGPDQNTLATISAPRPDGDFQLLSIGAVKAVGAGHLNVHLASTLGQSGVDSISAGVSYKSHF